MRRIGNSLQGLKRFLMLMNHPPPMLERNYRKIGVKFNEGSAPKMALGDFNMSLLFWLFIILLFVSEYFSEISFHVSEKCLTSSYPF